MTFQIRFLLPFFLLAASAQADTWRVEFEGLVTEVTANAANDPALTVGLPVVGVLEVASDTEPFDVSEIPGPIQDPGSIAARVGSYLAGEEHPFRWSLQFGSQTFDSDDRFVPTRRNFAGLGLSNALPPYDDTDRVSFIELLEDDFRSMFLTFQMRFSDASAFDSVRPDFSLSASGPSAFALVGPASIGFRYTDDSAAIDVGVLFEFTNVNAALVKAERVTTMTPLASGALAVCYLFIGRNAMRRRRSR